MKHSRSSSLLSLLAVLLWLPATIAAELKIPDVAAVAKDAGVVEKTFEGAKGAPIVVFEEMHNSRAGQIEEALALVRLHDRYGLRSIGLEGYLKERPAIKTDWFQNAVRGLSVTDRARIPVRLLKEGEISGAEFMKLVYENINLVPIETKVEHSVELGDAAATAPLQYLLHIALKSVRNEHAPKIVELQGSIERLTGDEKTKKVKELRDYIFSIDPWTKEKSKALLQEKSNVTVSAEQQLKLVEEIDARAKQLSVALEPGDKTAMQNALAFWRGRAKASDTMVTEIGRVSDTPNAPVVAMIIGAAHTPRICGLLRAEQRPYAVITPLSLKNNDKQGDLEWDSFERKYKRQPVGSDDISEALLKAFPLTGIKKPEPVLGEIWLQAKTEIHAFTLAIVRGILTQPSKRKGPAPYGYTAADLKGKWVAVDPNQIKEVVDDGGSGKGRAVLFPLILNPDDPARKEQIWVKAGLTKIVAEDARERETVEQMLMQVLFEVRSERPAPALVNADDKKVKKPEKAGRYPLAQDVMAAMAKTSDEARAIVLGSI